MPSSIRHWISETRFKKKGRLRASQIETAASHGKNPVHWTRQLSWTCEKKPLWMWRLAVPFFLPRDSWKLAWILSVTLIWSQMHRFSLLFWPKLTLPPPSCTQISVLNFRVLCEPQIASIYPLFLDTFLSSATVQKWQEKFKACQSPFHIFFCSHSSLGAFLTRGLGGEIKSRDMPSLAVIFFVFIGRKSLLQQFERMRVFSFCNNGLWDKQTWRLAQGQCLLIFCVYFRQAEGGKSISLLSKSFLAVFQFCLLAAFALFFK